METFSWKAYGKEAVEHAAGFVMGAAATYLVIKLIWMAAQ